MATKRGRYYTYKEYKEKGGKLTRSAWEKRKKTISKAVNKSCH